MKGFQGWQQQAGWYSTLQPGTRVLYKDQICIVKRVAFRNSAEDAVVTVVTPLGGTVSVDDIFAISPAKDTKPAKDAARRTRLHRALDCVLDRKSAKDAKPTFTFEQFVVKNPYMLGKYQKDIPAQRAVVAKALGEQAAKHYEKEQRATNKAYASFYDHYLQCCKIDMPPSWAQAHDAQGSGARLTQINREYNKLSAQQSKLTEKLIAEGHGEVRHSELHKVDSPTATEWLRLSSELNRLRLEGERIWGPDFRPGQSTYYHPKTIGARDVRLPDKGSALKMVDGYIEMSRKADACTDEMRAIAAAGTEQTRYAHYWKLKADRDSYRESALRYLRALRAEGLCISKTPYEMRNILLSE